MPNASSQINDKEVDHMEKSLYSLLLSDDVVSEIDRQALRAGLSRSALVNRILAEYASIQTPEMRIDSIFRQMEDLMGSTGDLVPFFTRGQQSMTMKSSLQYKYRPTVKYAVQLYKAIDGSGRFGELTVNFRTQSRSLLDEMTGFFGYWKLLEDSLIAGSYEKDAIDYALQDGRFIRTLALPKGSAPTGDELGEAISNYVKSFDSMLKAWLSGRLDASGLAESYKQAFPQGPGV